MEKVSYQVIRVHRSVGRLYETLTDPSFVKRCMTFMPLEVIFVVC